MQHHSSRLIRRMIVAGLLVAVTLPAVAATSSTSGGRISVAQVMDILDRAGSDGHAAQLLQAYLGGLGESAGVLISATDATGKPYVTCERSMALDAGLVKKVLAKAAPDKRSWGETAATPLIVNALVTRAGCH